jgi:uncharacterized membrane protein
MEIEQIAEILIYYLHAPLGGVALISGSVSVIAKKGGRIHRKYGKIFYYSMLITAISAFIISILPNHESPFLFTIGLFSMYFLIGGIRSLRFKNKEFDVKIDRIIAYTMIITGLFMIVYPIVLYGQLNTILTTFGCVGILFGLRDLKLFNDKERLRKGWLKLHLGKMTGGYIAAVSAFFVVNQILPGISNWFVPSVVGSVFITYWMNKLNKPKTLT